MRQILEALIRPSAVIQVLVLAVVFYFILNFVRGTRGANILKGLVFLFVLTFLGVMYVADLLELQEIKTMLTFALNGSAIALIIIFAPELRRGLSQLAQSPLLSPLLHEQSTKVVEELVTAAVRLSKNRIGALVAIERDVGLGEYIDNGVKIDAALTSELLETMFYPGSALHDGAVIIQRDRVAAAGCLFPLVDDPNLSRSMGTRHRAGIGVTADTDAVSLIVSEETGRISVAVTGRLNTDLNRESLEKILNELLYIRADKAETQLRLKKEKEEEPAAPAEPAPEARPALEGPNGPVSGGETLDDAGDGTKKREAAKEEEKK